MIPDDTLFYITEKQVRVFADVFPATAIMVRLFPVKNKSAQEEFARAVTAVRDERR